MRSPTIWLPDAKTNSLAVAGNVGYARVSSVDQDPALQLDTLAKAGFATGALSSGRGPQRNVSAFSPNPTTC